MIRLLIWLSLFLGSPALAQQGVVIGPVAPCTAFGTVLGTCAQSGSAGSFTTLIASTSFAVGSNNPGYKIWMSATTNENLVVTGHGVLADGIQLNAINDANNSYKGMQFTGSSFVFNNGGSSVLSISATGGLTATGIPASAGAGGLFLCIDTSGVIYKKATCP